MFRFTSLLPKEEELLFNQCYTDIGFKKTFDEVAKRYDIIELAKKANEKRDEINKNNYIYSTWNVFDGYYYTKRGKEENKEEKKEEEKEGSDDWDIRGIVPPLSPIRGDWIENMCDALFQVEARNIPKKAGFNGIIDIRRFRSLFNPMNDENRFHSVTVLSRYKDQKKYVSLSLPCDFIMNNWWMRLFYEIRSAEHLYEYRKRFIEEGWKERIAYTLYIYKFKYAQKMWHIAQQYVIKRFCKKKIKKVDIGKVDIGKEGKNRVEEKNEIREKNEVGEKENISINVKKADEDNKEINTPEYIISEKSIVKKPLSVSSSSTSSSDEDDEDRLEKKASKLLFGA